MLKVKISELKSKLSSYVARARAGESVLVLDRQTPVAKLVPIDGPGGGLSIRGPKRPLAELVRSARIPLRRPVDVVALLREERDRR